MAAAPVKAPESLAESQMRQLDNQEEFFGVALTREEMLDLPILG
jgi:hypothetical protein